MFTRYLQAAMRMAKYEILENNEGFYGEIPRFQGVWANADNLEDCRNELEEVLEEWIMLRLQANQSIPKIDDISLVVQRQT